MNTVAKALAGACVILLVNALAGCVPTGSRNEYFGYNNSPRAAETSTPPPEDRSWINPARPDPPPPDRNEYYYDTSNDYRSYGYVPVVVPWWDGYYGWPGFTRPYVSVQVSYGYRPMYNPWYSPWYDYNPFYGGVCRNWGYSSWHRPWQYDSWRYSPPVWRNWPPAPPRTPERTGTRTFGPQSGDYPAPNGTGGSSGVITSGSRTRTTIKQATDNPPDVKSVIKTGAGAAAAPTGMEYILKNSRTTTTEPVRETGSERSRVQPAAPSRPAEKTAPATTTTNERKRNP